MTLTRTMGWGMVGAATTVLTRKAARTALHKRSGAPRLPNAIRRDHGFGTMVLLAAAAGALLALSDVLREQQQRVAQRPTIG